MRRELNAQIALLRNREEILNRQMGDLMQRNREVPAVELNLQRLQRDAKVNDDLLTLLKTRHQEALIKESEGVEEVTIVRPATEPAAPIGSEAFNTVLVGALLGPHAGRRAGLRAGDARHLHRHHRGRRVLSRGPRARHRAAHRSARDDAAPHRAPARRWPRWIPKRCRATRCSSPTSIPSRRWPRPTAPCAPTSSSRGWSAAARCWWSPAPRCRRARPPPSSTSRSPWPRTARRRCWSAPTCAARASTGSSASSASRA